MEREFGIKQMRVETKAIVEQKEAAFQKCLKEYDSNPNKKTWDPLWSYVYDACLNIGKSKCYGLRVQNLEDKCLDATMKVMKKIKEGTRPEKLSSFCYLYVIGVIYNKKQIRIDREVDIDLFLNNTKYTCEFGQTEVYLDGYTNYNIGENENEAQKENNIS